MICVCMIVENELMLISYPLGPTRLHTVDYQVQKFESRFGSLVDKAYQEVNGKVDPSDFLFRVTYLPASAHTLHRSFIKENLTDIPPPLTHVKIWVKLTSTGTF